MAYRWRYQDAAGAEVVGPVEEFADDQAAEFWLEQNWGDLLDGGVEQVTLLDGESEVYGPMSLRPSDPDPA